MSKYMFILLLAVVVMLTLAASAANGRRSHRYKIGKRATRKGKTELTETRNGNKGGDAVADAGGEDIGIQTIEIEITTHEPPMTEEQEKEEVCDIDINVALDAILLLPDSKAPKAVKDGIKKLIKYSGQLQGPILKALSMVSSAVKSGIDMLIQFVQQLLLIVAGVAMSTDDMARQIRTEVRPALKTVLDFLLKGKGTLGGVIDATIKRLSKVAKLRARVNSFANFLVGGLRKILKLIQDTAVFKFTITANVMTDIIKKLIGMISGGHGPLTNAVENVLESAQGRKLDFLGGLRSMISFATKETIPLLSHLVNMLGTVGKILGPILETILGSVFSVVKGLSLNG